MESIAASFGAPSSAAVAGITAAHSGQPSGTAPLDTLFQVTEFIMRLSERAQRLS
jgi:hypothetical protein